MTGNRGRLSMAIHPLSWFTDKENGVTPFDGELCFDDETFDILIWHKRDDGSWYTSSKTKDISSYLEDLKQSGVFTAASAFVNNRKIYRFFFDQMNGVVRLDPDLRFDPVYRYYAIRKTDLSPTGAYVYVTGVSGTGVDGDTVVSSLVDIIAEDSEAGDGTQVGVPQVGGLVEELIGGNTYVVEFYNVDRELVNMQTYQAIAVRTAELDIAPDTAVTDMFIQSNQSYAGDDNAIYFYRGQDVGQVEIETYLKYADGRTRSVTNEQTIGGRLSILGLDEISTDTVTVAGDTPQTFEIVYTLVRSNASLPPSTTQTESGAIISPASLTISKTIKVYVIEDVTNSLNEIIPAGYITLADNRIDHKIVMKYFGHYTNGLVQDITNVASHTGFNDNLMDNSIQHIKVQVPIGNTGTEFKVKDYTIAVPNYSNNSQNPVTIDPDKNQPNYILFSNPAEGDLYGKFTGFETYNKSLSKYETLSYESLLNRMTFGNEKPTHIRVRDVMDSQYTYTDIVNAATGTTFNTVGTGHEITKDRALLVEFYKLVTDAAGIAVSVFATGAMVVYAKASAA